MARPSQACEWLPWWCWASGSVSAGSDGERVEVVGEDRPPGPDLHSVIVFQSGSAQPVAAFEVTDPALDPGAVAGSAFAGPAFQRVGASVRDPRLRQPDEQNGTEHTLEVEREELPRRAVA